MTTTMTFRRLFSRAATALLLMLLTTATAWADVTFSPAIIQSDLLSNEAFAAVTFTLKKDGVTVATLEHEVDVTLDAGTYTITCNKTAADGIYVNYSGAEYLNMTTYEWGTYTLTQTGNDATFTLPDLEGFTMPTITVAGNQYKVTYDANGGNGTMADQIMEYGEATALTAIAFTNGSESFAGWSTAADGDVEYADRQTVTNLAARGETVTLYAQWGTAVSYIDGKSYTTAAFAADWKEGLQVSHTRSAYSTMCLQKDGRIAFFYEEEPYIYNMVYVPLTLSQITKGEVK